MFELAKKNNFHFDAVLFPSNVLDWNFRSFVHQVMPVALKNGTAVQTMKSMGGKFIPENTAATPAECLRYALSQPTSVVIAGMDKMEYLEDALQVVKGFQPLTKEQISQLTSKVQQAAMTGNYEKFKTTNHFDATAMHPEWLGKQA